jgi:hypothetical protein
MTSHATTHARHRQSRWDNFAARKRRRPPLLEALRRAALTTAVLTAAVGTAAILDVPTTMTFADQPPPSGPRPETQLNADIDRLNAKHECFSAGLGEGVVPEHAVVRRDGTAVLMSFDAGWAVHEGKAPGTLVSVCAR